MDLRVQVGSMVFDYSGPEAEGMKLYDDFKLNLERIVKFNDPKEYESLHAKSQEIAEKLRINCGDLVKQMHQYPELLERYNLPLLETLKTLTPFLEKFSKDVTDAKALKHIKVN